MENSTVLTPQYPDFGALLESVRENGRRMQESAERYALCKPAAFKLFKKEGIEIDRIYEGIHKAKEDGQDVMEIDVALCDTSVAVIVEVKTRCGKHDIDYFLSQMEHCKEYYKEFADKKLLVAVAAISFDTGAVKYAHKKGVYVLKLTGEETFTLSAPNNPKAF